MSELIAVVSIALCFVLFIPVSVVVVEIGFRLTTLVLETLGLD